MTDRPTAATAELPSRARVVIIGGGVIGTSVAYHLAQLGWTDIVLLEQGQLSGGTTWHAAGLVGQLRATESGTRLVQYSMSLYERLEAETGLATGVKRCGGVTVARTPERMTQLLRTAANAAAYDLECEIISPTQARDRYPILETSDLVGAVWLPGDGTVNPTDLTQSLARGARMRGARIYERVRVIGIQVAAGAVTGVETDRGFIAAEVVVNCAGQWAKAVGSLCGVTVPLHSAEHFYVVTDAIDGVHRDLPILRDPDGYTYVKEEVGGLVVGGFEPDAKPWVAPDAIPYPFEFELLGEDWDHFSVLMDSAMHRLPVLRDTGIKKFYNGPESFTPDNQFVMGEAPGLRGFFVGAGFNSVGIATAGGAGRALAEWIVAGEPTSDLSAVDIRRFAPFMGDNDWLRARVGEVLGLHYAIPWPNRELMSARPVLTSPAYEQLAADGAVFGTKLGWERVNVFAPRGQEPVVDYSWERPAWLAWSIAEQLAARSAVAVFDQTSFGKLRITGPDATAVLQWVCAADVDVPVGQAVYTGLLNHRGGFEGDVTLTRTAAEEYLLVTSAGSPVRDRDWIERHAAADRSITITDVTADYAVYGVMGPVAGELLGRLGAPEVTEMPFATSRLVSVAGNAVRATRITYVGEVGWELYVPVAAGADVYAALLREGQDLGVVPAGYYTINSMRLEMGYRAWPSDIGPDYSPVEAGLLFATKLGIGSDFLGRAAVAAARADGVRRRLVSFVLDDPEPMMWGGELLIRHGEPVGQVTSAAFGATVGSCVGLAYVWRPDGGPITRAELPGSDYEIDIGGARIPATVSLSAPYRPAISPSNTEP
jgi:4-methylaminobutanoate oxidase (formaldehyde-forming)